MKKLIITITTITTLFSCNKIEKTGISDPNCKNHEHHVATSSYVESYDPNTKITIIGLNNVSRDRLLEAEKIVKNFYKFKTEVKSSNIKVEDRFYYDVAKTTINCDPFVRNFSTNERILFITDSDMRGNVNPSVRGYTTVNGRVIIATSSSDMKETVIHEIGHTFGLLHCNNLTCVMAIFNDQYDSGTFCNECRTSINYK